MRGDAHSGNPAVGTGRERILSVTIAKLRQGAPIRIAEIGEEADVSPALIYKYFDDRDDLVAEAYAQIFKGLQVEDVATLDHFDPSSEDLRDSILALHRAILHRDRDDVRWSRLEALALSRRNPGIARRVDDARAELVASFMQVAARLAPGQNPRRLRGQALVALGIALGITAMAPEDFDDELREDVAQAWTDIVMLLLRPPSA